MKYRTVPALMNLPYYLEFLNWRLSGNSEGILERNIATLLESVEVVAMLRVLCIIHISVVMPMRWLAGKTQELGDHNFGVADMAECVDLMEKAFESVRDDPNLFFW